MNKKTKQKAMKVKVPASLFTFVSLSRSGNKIKPITYVLNKLTIISTVIFFLGFFASYFMKTDRFGELNMILYVYSFLIVVAGIQFIKFMLGGERYFAKINLDIFLLTIPPVLILSLLLKDEVVDIFGTIYQWSYSVVAIVAVILFVYILGLNFSNKKGEKLLSRVFDLGIILGGAAYLLGSAANYFDNSNLTVGAELFLITLIPIYTLKALVSQDKIVKFISTVICAINFIILIKESFSFKTTLDQSSPNLSFVYVAFIIFVIYLISLFYWTRKYRSGLKNKLLKKAFSIKEKLTQDKKSGILDIVAISIFIITLVFVKIILFLAIKDSYLVIAVDSVRDSFVTFWNLINGVGDFLFGFEAIKGDTYFYNLLTNYGFIGAFILIIAPFIIAISYMKKDLKFESLVIIAMVISSFLFNITYIFFFVIWFMVIKIAINTRENDVEFSDLPIAKVRQTNVVAVNILIMLLRILLSVAVFVLIFVLLYALNKSVGTGLFIQ